MPGEDVAALCIDFSCNGKERVGSWGPRVEGRVFVEGLEELETIYMLRRRNQWRGKQSDV